MFALATIPLVAVPLYFVFGRSRFEDYTDALSELEVDIADALDKAKKGPLEPFLTLKDDGSREAGEMRAFNEMATLPFTNGNGVRLLIDGDATFQAIFAGIDAAERYVLAQFYIVHDDRIGTAFKDRLIAAAQRGVEVRFMYDSIGSLKLPRRYLRDLEDAGVTVLRVHGSSELAQEAAAQLPQPPQDRGRGRDAGVRRRPQRG